MINYDLPKSIFIDGKEYTINKNGDYRVILDIICALNDNSLSQQEKAYISLNIFYNFDIPQNMQVALDEMLKFINCGNERDTDELEKPPIMNWEQDFPLMIAPINKALGYEIRAVDYLHWWTFVGGYQEIDDNNTFSTVLKIRQKRQRGLKLDKEEERFYRENYKIVDLKKQLTEEEMLFLNSDVFGEEA